MNKYILIWSILTALFGITTIILGLITGDSWQINCGMWMIIAAGNYGLLKESSK
jgi:hypothetical protein